MIKLQQLHYRFEFQKRGTVHLHLLIWLHNLSHIQHKHIRADIPTSDQNLAYLLHKLQKSDKPSAFLPLQTHESYFESQN